MKNLDTLVLTRSDVEALLSPDASRAAVEEAFRVHGSGETPPPAVLGLATRGGGFHIKSGLLRHHRHFFAAKVNGNFDGNAARGLARIQGVVVLSDGDTGVPLALLDSASITTLRTAAATAVAAQYFARPDAAIVTVCGCGVQGRAQLVALMRVRPIRKVFAFDIDRERAQRFACEVGDELGIDAAAVDDLRAASRASAIVVTCTPSRQPLLFDGFLTPGSFVAAVGADSEEKQELDAALLASVTLVTDVTAQCMLIGDLHHAIKAGVLSRDSVHAELGEVVAGRKRGPLSPDEIVVFDSTGMALQDVAAAAAAYERAVEAGRGTAIALSS
ncbi:MAG: ornithine cyclodeaminase family protein [Burkholderiaceae bacterium]